MRGDPPGYIGRATRSSWINVDLFVHFLERIIELTGCTTE